MVAEIPSDEVEDGLDSDLVCLMAITGSGASMKTSKWYVDSGASAHMNFDRSVFADYEHVTPFPAKMGDKSTSTAMGRGNVHLQLLVNGVTRMCMLRNVLHVRSFAIFLISVSALAREGVQLQFCFESAKILRDKGMIATGTRTGGLYSLDTPVTHDQGDTSLAADSQLWHERLGHVHRAGIEHISYRYMPTCPRQ